MSDAATLNWQCSQTHGLVNQEIVTMRAAKVKPGDVVRVTAEHSKYLGSVGVVKSLTKTGLSARVNLEDGRTPTLRVSSLRVTSKPDSTVKVSADRLAKEVHELGREVAMMVEVLQKVEELLALDSEWMKDEVVMVACDVRDEGTGPLSERKVMVNKV